MYNLHNFQGLVIEMTSYSHHATKIKHENRPKMRTKDTCYYEKRFIDKSFLVFEILSGGTMSKKPIVNRVMVENVNYTLFISTSGLSRKFISVLPINYISEKYFKAISFTLANNNIWSVKKLQANLSSWKLVETQLFSKCKTHVSLKKVDKILMIQLYIYMAALNYQFSYLSHPVFEVNFQNFPGKKFSVPQTIMI